MEVFKVLSKDSIVAELFVLMDFVPRHHFPALDAKSFRVFYSGIGFEKVSEVLKLVAARSIRIDVLEVVHYLSRRVIK